MKKESTLIGMKIFNGLFLAIILVLIFMSILAIVLIHWKLFEKYSYNFSPEGINIYLISLGQFKALFTATIATIAAYFGLLRLKIATESNIEKIKQDRFQEWKNILEIRLTAVENTDPHMRREFTRIRFNFFKQLNDFNFSISNKTQLTKVFETHFKYFPDYIECHNKRHNELCGIYPDMNYSYSFSNFFYVFLGCIESFYPEIDNDLKNLYIEKLPKKRTINKEAFESSQ